MSKYNQRKKSEMMGVMFFNGGFWRKSAGMISVRGPTED